MLLRRELWYLMDILADDKITKYKIILKDNYNIEVSIKMWIDDEGVRKTVGRLLTRLEVGYEWLRRRDRVRGITISSDQIKILYDELRRVCKEYGEEIGIDRLILMNEACKLVMNKVLSKYEKKERYRKLEKIRELLTQAT